jgi:hypothetical protein
MIKRVVLIQASRVFIVDRENKDDEFDWLEAFTSQFFKDYPGWSLRAEPLHHVEKLINGSDYLETGDDDDEQDGQQEE